MQHTLAADNCFRELLEAMYPSISMSVASFLSRILMVSSTVSASPQNADARGAGLG
jgi:hypothetical protein